jgi:hypothetical protein
MYYMYQGLNVPRRSAHAVPCCLYYLYRGHNVYQCVQCAWASRSASQVQLAANSDDLARALYGSCPVTCIVQLAGEVQGQEALCTRASALQVWAGHGARCTGTGTDMCMRVQPVTRAAVAIWKLILRGGVASRPWHGIAMLMPVLHHSTIGNGHHFKCDTPCSARAWANSQVLCNSSAHSAVMPSFIHHLVEGIMGACAHSSNGVVTPEAQRQHYAYDGTTIKRRCSRGILAQAIAIQHPSRYVFCTNVSL